MNQLLTQSVAGPRSRSLLLWVFAGLALALAVAGVYELVSYSVEQRTREIGVRMAFGAQSRNIRWMAMKEGVAIIIVGGGFGLAMSFAFMRLIRAYLYRVGPADPVRLSWLFVLGTTAALASYIPARRATNVDPSVMLRHN
jgi:putative ABC transport system permease protein